MDLIVGWRFFAGWEMYGDKYTDVSYQFNLKGNNYDRIDPKYDLQRSLYVLYTPSH